jgi:hypothetical protein
LGGAAQAQRSALPQLKDRKLKVVSSFCIVILVAGSICSGQTQSAPSEKTSWEVFAPAGMRFRIEVPAKPHRNDNEYGDTDPKGYKLIRVYEPCESCLTHSAYQIIVLVPSKSMQEKVRGMNKLAGLEFTIGGDDAEPASESNIVLNGLKGARVKSCGK